MTKIIIDAYGGDNAPLEVLRGARMAADEYGVLMVLCGKEDEMREVAEKNNISLAGMEIAHAPGVMPMGGEPTDVLKAHSDSSMALGLKMLAEGKGDAFVSAGSTGALVVGASLIVKRLKGIKRPAIGTMIPNSVGAYMLMDSGANAECRPEMLLQFGIMGSAYMQKIMNMESPRVGVVNIGAEETKGLDLQIEAGKLLHKAPVNFVGNVEAREIPLGGCDVAVCDGFVGNIILKHTEGMGKLLSLEFKNILLKNAGTKFASIFLKDGIAAFRKKLDYAEHGGAPLMGISKPVIKAHGSSNAQAFKNAIRQAKTVHETGVIAEISSALKQMAQEEGE